MPSESAHAQTKQAESADAPKKISANARKRTPPAQNADVGAMNKNSEAEVMKKRMIEERKIRVA